MLKSAVKFFQEYDHAILFSFFGLCVVGWPLASARWYFAYLVGLVFVWTLPSSSKRNQFFGYTVLAFSVFAKIYLSYISPTLSVKAIPIAMYNGTMIQSCDEVSHALVKNLHEKFASEIDLHSKNPKMPRPQFDNAVDHTCTGQQLLFDSIVSYGLLDLTNVWSMPVDVLHAFNPLPIVIAVKIEKADRGKIWFGDWKDNVFFEQNTKNDIKTHAGEQVGIELKENIGHTFFFPLIASAKPSSVYVELMPLGVYIPLILFLAAILFVNLSKVNAKFLEHIICLSISFITICLADNWPKQIFPYENLHSIVSWMFNGVWGSEAGQAPLWFVVNKLFYCVSGFGYLLPILCFWASALCSLRILRILLNETYAYIGWGILMMTPWLAKNGMGLNIYHSWYMLHSSLMLGMPLFLFGLLGYMRDFKTCHGLSWVAACLCSPIIFAGVSCLFLHKHIGRQRFVYLALSLFILILANLNHLSHLLAAVPLSGLISVTKIVYNPTFIMIGLIPNILLAFSKNIDFKRFARMALVMHVGGIAGTLVPQELYLACTLSAICSFVYLEPLVNKIKTFC